MSIDDDDINGAGQVLRIAGLDGPVLDYWVAKAQGLDVKLQDGQAVVGVGPSCYVYAPSTTWAQGGPIIEREHIDLVHDFGAWMAMHEKHERYGPRDPSPLVAAMRAYLMWEYGDEVPII
jgi:hypothetical protein